ncbi:hypothetical protein CXB51_032025 [Gossypium anomalum]|uniref:Glycosyl transferase CAP10 domain-containing protein n=1 Tax=Gossypium anomalum TaxID=47600 RepID=A0A8J6CJW6_9ROSI|nr:hypothetical protein CXB51_032025 [Gossypium anomalum]
MGEHAKIFPGFWPYGDQVILGCIHKVGLGRFKGLVSTTAFLFLFSFPIIQGSPLAHMSFTSRSNKKPHERVEFPLNCSVATLQGKKCPNKYPSVFEPDESSTETCPDYFRWIHQDLQLWKTSGITEDMIERGKASAHFRLVIVGGNVYVEKYTRPYQTRDVFTKWGILQLLRLYPGKVPDLDILFYSGDETKIMRSDYQGPNSTLAPPLAEVNIMPWEDMLRAIKKGRKRTKWEQREPYAFWKGSTWSVSKKYILACDSMTLMIKPRYFDFFSRSMMPMQHYWPIRRQDKCRDLKFAVEWGNNHTQQAQDIGKAGSKFIEEILTMRNVYDYMFHLLNEYSKLLKYKPTVPSKARRICVESTACKQKGVWKEFLFQSLVKSPSHKPPCELPPPYEPQAIQASMDKIANIDKQVENWGNVYWNKLNDTNQ